MKTLESLLKPFMEDLQKRMERYQEERKSIQDNPNQLDDKNSLNFSNGEEFEASTEINTYEKCECAFCSLYEERDLLKEVILPKLESIEHQLFHLVQEIKKLNQKKHTKNKKIKEKS